MRTEYKLFSVTRVRLLEQAAVAGWILLITMIIAFVIVFHQRNEAIAKYQTVSEQQQKQKQEEYRMISSIRGVIHENNPSLSYEQVDKMAGYELKYSKINHIDPAIGLAISMQESNFNPNAVSYTGCCLGQKQINFSAHREEYGIKTRKELLDPEYNIQLGYRLMADNVDRYGTMGKALQHYYGSTDSRENIIYMKSVMSKAKQIRRDVS